MKLLTGSVTKRNTRWLIGVGLAICLAAAPLIAFAADSTVWTSQVQGILPDSASQDYIPLHALDGQSAVKLAFEYAPNASGLEGKVNFYVVNANGLHEIEAGVAPYAVNIAAGNMADNSDNHFKLYAAFTPNSNEEFSVVVESNAWQPVSYTLSVSNGELRGTPPAAPSANRPAAPAQSAAVVTPSRPTVVEGKSIQAHEQQWVTLTPVERDGSVILSMKLLSASVSSQDGRINFFVFDESGLQALRAGAGAETVNMAAGSYVESSDTLRAQFTAAGHNPYYVMVTNSTNAPATYKLNIQGGQFSAE